MNYIVNTFEFHIDDPCVVALGKFDGLHEGHRYLLNAMNMGAEDCKKVLFTFDVPPSILKSPDYQTILSREERRIVFREEHIDTVIECPFNEQLRTMKPYEFLSFLKERLNVKKIVVGTDFRFGYQRAGSYKTLQQYADEFGYETVVVEKKQDQGRDISSTRIREAILQGDISAANRLLGYPYFVQGCVVYGNQIGRTIGFPTANIVPAEHKVLPPNGVYSASVILQDGRCCNGICNIGRKPTIQGQYPVGVETFLFDFNESLYGQDIIVQLKAFLRKEQQFENLDCLVEQMKRDIQRAQSLINS